MVERPSQRREARVRSPEPSIARAAGGVARHIPPTSPLPFPSTLSHECRRDYIFQRSRRGFESRLLHHGAVAQRQSAYRLVTLVVAPPLQASIMCDRLFLAAPGSPPLVPMTDPPSFSVAVPPAADIARVRPRFPEGWAIRELGAHTGCACGFRSQPRWLDEQSPPDPAELARERASCRALAAYVEGHCGQGPVHLYDRWNGAEDFAAVAKPHGPARLARLRARTRSRRLARHRRSRSADADRRGPLDE